MGQDIRLKSKRKHLLFKPWFNIFCTHNQLYLCLVQNSFGRSKMVLVWPNWFGLDHNDLVTTKMIWSRPKWFGHDQNEMVAIKMNWSCPNVIHFGRKSQFRPDQLIHFGRDHFILVVTKSLWSSPNQFGQTKTILDRPKLFWSYRRTRH